MHCNKAPFSPIPDPHRENAVGRKIVDLMGAGLLATFGSACGPAAALKYEAVEPFDHHFQSAESRLNDRCQ